jgi:hypothetical protein
VDGNVVGGNVDEADALMFKVPALYEHCRTVFNAMVEEAEFVEPTNNNPERQQVFRQWEGHTTKLVAKCGLSVPYYSRVMRSLQAMDCVRQLRRGGGGSKSIWLLVQEPTLELFGSKVDDPQTGSAKSSREKMQDQSLRALNERLTRVEEALGL